MVAGTQLEGKVCVVTGGTGAIGKALSAELARRSGLVVMVSRDGMRGSEARDEVAESTRNASVEQLVCDLSSLQSVRGAGEELRERHPKIHVLVHTAATYSKRQNLTLDGLEMMFATNHLGPFLLTNLLLPPLKAAAPSRVIIVSAPSSTELDFDDLQGTKGFNALHAFGSSQSANLLFTFALARRLEGSGVTANAVHPGLTKSQLMQELPAPLRMLLHLISRK